MGPILWQTPKHRAPAGGSACVYQPGGGHVSSKREGVPATGQRQRQVPPCVIRLSEDHGQDAGNPALYKAA